MSFKKMNIYKNIWTIYRKLFISGDWNIAYRRTNLVDYYHDTFIIIPNTKEYWYADPLVFEIKGKAYIFCEAFNRVSMKGELGFFEILPNDKISDFKLIMSPNYHLSFPFVFEKGHDLYMIPESAEHETLDLYIADDFPTKWSLKKTLLKGKYADPTIVEIDGSLYLFVYIEKDNRFHTKIYKIRDLDISLEEVQDITYTANVGRSAGNFFTFAGDLYRPVQMNKNEYGKSTLIYRVCKKDGLFEEILTETIDNKHIKVGNTVGVDKIHTLSKGGTYETIDYVLYKFDLLKRFKIIIRKYKLKNRKKNASNSK